MKGVGLYEMGGCIRKLNNTEGHYETTAGKGTTKLMNSFGKQNNNAPHVSSFSLYFCPSRIQMARFFLFLKNVNGKAIHFTVAS